MGRGETWGRSQRFGCVRMVDGRAYWYATVNVAEGASAVDVRSDVVPDDAIRIG